MSDKITNETILNEIRKLKQDINLRIQALEVNITLKIEEVNRRLSRIEKEKVEIGEKVEKIERKLKENNIVIFGLHLEQELSCDVICHELKKLVDVTVNESDLNNFYRLGNNKNCPIKVEFVSYLKKSLILKNKNKLRGTNISIVNDQTIKQREENKILRRHLHLNKQNTTNCYIKGNKLYIDDQAFTLNELEAIEHPDPEVNQTSSSAPSTPIGHILKNNKSIETLEKAGSIEKPPKIDIPKGQRQAITTTPGSSTGRKENTILTRSKKT